MMNRSSCFYRQCGLQDQVHISISTKAIDSTQPSDLAQGMRQFKPMRRVLSASAIARPNLGLTTNSASTGTIVTAQSILHSIRPRHISRLSSESQTRPATHHLGVGRRYKHSTSTTMADKSTSTVELLSQILTPDFLQELRTFWFQGCNGPETLILPTQADTMRYFTKDTEFDKACV